MNKTIQKHISLIGGLFFLAQSAMVPAATAAGFMTTNQSIYWNAATSAEPIIFNDDRFIAESADKVIENAASGYSIGSVIERANGSGSVDRVIDNPEPTVQEVKDYVLNEIKKAGLNARQADAIVTCESRWDYKAVNNKNRNGSNDKGLWQINSIHKNITDAEKLDYKASTKWAITKRLADGNWSAWSCSRRIAVKTSSAAPVIE